MKKTYVTTAIPYVNGAPHIGHALDYCLADVYARYRKMRGDDVRLQAGTDEHGSKIWQKAVDLGIPVEDYVNNNVKKFQDFIHSMEVDYTDFVRTTDPEHEKRCQEIWGRLEKHIYKNKYEGWYCSGCERFVTEKEYTENNGICPDHAKFYEWLEEENYYFRISDFRDKIKEAIESGEMTILPEFRKKEMLALLVDSPDVSISRPRMHLEWGISVPNDVDQVMYVWIDALANYITVLGYPEKDISEWWPADAQFVGKDILRFHTIIWPAMLLGLGLPLPSVMVSHGFILADGQKMSKSIGNVVDPAEVIKKHGAEAFRYYFLKHIDTFLDSDFTWTKFEDAYNNELANDLGNLVQRLATLAKKNDFKLKNNYNLKFPEKYYELMDNFEFSKAFELIWNMVQKINHDIDERKPWSLAKNGQVEDLADCLQGLIVDLLCVKQMLLPFLPDTCEKITAIFTNPIVPPKTPLFPKS